MDIKVVKSLVSTNKPEAVINHKGQSLSFLINGIIRNSVIYEFDVFQYLNEYWATLPEAKLDHIFGLYTQARNAYNTIVNKSQLNNTLNKLCVELTDMHDFDMVYEWVIYKSDIKIPEIFENEYKYDYDKQGSREQTYIRSDYTKLITLIIILKTMIPIWGEHMEQGKDDSGNMFKEYYSFQLLHGSRVSNSASIEKLFIYVRSAIGPKKENSSTIIEGISSEDYPYWILSQVIIHRLCVGDIRGLDPKANIITYLYKYISQKNQSAENNNERSIKEKSRSEYDGDMGDKISSLERYKVKHDISIGEIVELTYSIRDLRSIAFKLSPNMTEELFQSSQTTCKKLLDHDLKMPQLNILRWVFKPVISSKGVLYLDKSTIVGCLGVLEAVLYSTGFEFLAMLSTSYVTFEENNIYLSSTDSRARIPKEHVAQLDNIYPYQSTIGGKKTGYKKVNPAIQAIDSTVEQLFKHSWVCTASSDKIEKVFGLKENIRLTIPYNIKIQLADLTIKIGSRGRVVPNMQELIS